MTVLRRFYIGIASVLLTVLALPALAQDADAPIQQLLQEHGEIIAKSSRKTIGPAIDALGSSSLPKAPEVLEKWQAKELWFIKETGLFVYTEKVDSKTERMIDIATGEVIGEVAKRDLKQLKPNSGIRGLIGAALVKFQLQDPSVAARNRALDAIERDAEDTHLAALRDVMEAEENPDIAARMARLERLLTIEFGESDDERIDAINHFAGDLGVDVRAALNPLVAVRVEPPKPRPRAMTWCAF